MSTFITFNEGVCKGQSVDVSGMPATSQDAVTDRGPWKYAFTAADRNPDVLNSMAEELQRRDSNLSYSDAIDQVLAIGRELEELSTVFSGNAEAAGAIGAQINEQYVAAAVRAQREGISLSDAALLNEQEN